MNYKYITKEEISVAYFQFPKFLLKYPISQNGKVVYMLLYDRARLSQMNNWLDENGRIYVIYPITELIKHQTAQNPKCLLDLVTADQLL